MYSLETIRKINKEACETAKKKNLPNLLILLTDIADFGKEKIPHIGDCDEDIDIDHERIDTLFCDLSGMGAPYEPALTQEQLKVKLGEIIGEHGPILVALGEIGQFQGHLGIWKAEMRS